MYRGKIFRLKVKVRQLIDRESIPWIKFNGLLESLARFVVFVLAPKHHSHEEVSLRTIWCLLALVPKQRSRVVRSADRLTIIGKQCPSLNDSGSNLSFRF